MKIFMIFFLMTVSSSVFSDCLTDNNCLGILKCVKRCFIYSSAGKCVQYGADYCEKDATCATKCLKRSSLGICIDYDRDFCGPNAVCSPHCTQRSSLGECISYDPDVCDIKINKQQQNNVDLTH